MKYWLLLAVVVWVGPSRALAQGPLPYRFTEYPPVDARGFLPAVQQTIAKTKIGMTRQEAAYDLRPKTGSLLSPVETYYVGSVLTWSEHGTTVFFDCIFQPASMNDAAFAEAFPHVEQLRRNGRWPAPAAKDVLRAVSPPYFGQRPAGGALEVSILPLGDRKRLQTLKVGMTRREILRTFEPARGMIRPPVEPYDLRGSHPLNRYQCATVDIAFRPVAMDAAVYVDPAQRAAWFRRHPYLPGDDLEDVVMDFYRPRITVQQSGEPVIDLRKLSEADRERLQILQVGMTRKQVAKTFSPCGGLFSPWHGGVHFIPGPLATRISRDPRALISVELNFLPADFSGTEGEFLQSIQRSGRFTRESDSDVLTAFGRPFASTQWLAID